MMMGDGPVVLMGLDLARGHAAKIERTAFLGDPPQRDVELFEAMTGAGGIAHSMVRPDACCADIDLAIRGFLRSLGRGIGLGNHEARS